eukprot:Hpha_TRINITY_DN19162_c0_g1::TRINITY_DN19162_c0_g1_i1::g.94782::m.94782
MLQCPAWVFFGLSCLAWSVVVVTGAVLFNVVVFEDVHANEDAADASAARAIVGSLQLYLSDTYAAANVLEAFYASWGEGQTAAGIQAQATAFGVSLAVARRRVARVGVESQATGAEGLAAVVWREPITDVADPHGSAHQFWAASHDPASVCEGWCLAVHSVDPETGRVTVAAASNLVTPRPEAPTTDPRARRWGPVRREKAEDGTAFGVLELETWVTRLQGGVLGGVTVLRVGVLLEDWTAELRRGARR